MVDAQYGSDHPDLRSNQLPTGAKAVCFSSQLLAATAVVSDSPTEPNLTQQITRSVDIFNDVNMPVEDVIDDDHEMWAPSKRMSDYA